jgi:hypothetical protein
MGRPIPRCCSRKQDHLDVGDDESSRTQLGRLVIGKPYLNDTFWSNQVSDGRLLGLWA